MAPRHPNIATETSKGLFRDQNTLMALAKLGGEEIVTTSGDSQWWSASLTIQQSIKLLGEWLLCSLVTSPQRFWGALVADRQT